MLVPLPRCLEQCWQCPAWGERGSDTVRLGLSCFLGTLWPWCMEMLPKCNAVSARSAKKTALAAHNGREIRFCFAFLELPRVCAQLRIQSLGSLCPVPDHQVTSRGTKALSLAICRERRGTQGPALASLPEPGESITASSCPACPLPAPAGLLASAADWDWE